MEQSNESNKEKIISAIRNATNGTFIGSCGMRTLMGYIKRYDEQGREVSVDPNYISSCVIIEDVKYSITRVGWDVFIWKSEYPDAQYAWCWRENRDDYLFAHINIMPDYVEEYIEKHKKNDDRY